MSNIIELKVGNEVVKFEADQVEASGEVSVSRFSSVAEVTQNSLEETFDAAVLTAKISAERFLSLVDDLSKKPSSLELEFGLNVNGQLDAYVVKGSSDAHYKIKLTWESS